MQVKEPTIPPTRLGKFDASNQSRARPIRIKLNSVDDVFTAIGNVKKLRALNKWTNINISRDRTPMQIKLFHSVKDELKRRTDSGENLKILYRGGIPTIVSSEN